ncbi:Oidioi.mRNA.OKI2018_I69.XSR.g13916.t1.cds [Oikopleura dioica]|uniref:Oidioi.mRNA.OKI2018_I69.XSR.g13916.t1.cds n=1 Tax=Oikopleura dioica TaxID=34765 RepID=A0ABN7S8A1_OIKDI|nr:Oidioi.mRNA.OKI2018_I69.XSR.g13916.t1.cds [Oikopleura dioica]
MKVSAVLASCVAGGFQLGTDYNFECQENGILVTSEDSSFVLTDRAKNIETECKATSHWNNSGGSIYLPQCIQIKEDTRNWNGLIITRKEGPRKWKSQTIFVECVTGKSEHDPKL